MGAFVHMPHLWLDVTRLLTRIGRGALTGVDRVELAYLNEALSSGCDRYLCRTTRGYLVLDRRGALCLRDLAEGALALGRADVLSRLTLRSGRPRHRAEAMLRPLAIDRCRPKGLPRMLDRLGARDATYVNVGHSNLSQATLSAFAKSNRVVVMVHDLIPLTHPQFVVADQPAVFAAKIARVRHYATHVIANSAATASDLATHWGGKSQPKSIVAHLSVPPFAVAEKERVPGHFVMLGTIEPRKNHALIIDVWEALAEELAPDAMPTLHIIGATGWNVSDLMARLHTHPQRGRSIFIHGALPDAEVQSHLAQAQALLFPSEAEGFGFPPLEAAMAGAVPICSNLPVFREILGDCAVYVDSNDAYQWKETIKQLLDGTKGAPDLAKLTIPTWQEHFEIVTDAIIAQQLEARP